MRSWTKDTVPAELFEYYGRYTAEGYIGCCKRVKWPAMLIEWVMTLFYCFESWQNGLDLAE